ncbi:hypothetical protein AB0F52_47720 [Amycolatopsis sp. NPDC024027]|uniref:hypothetical protein n=1 Tax=Amycolatopsis sp. NPDC024027 TaxID=3154327 RepID=UPI0033E9AB9F
MTRQRPAGGPPTYSTLFDVRDEHVASRVPEHPWPRSEPLAGVVNSLIAAEYAAGASISELAERWGIDPRQVVERISAATRT